MRLRGILDFSLGNFLCLRGFARMGEIYDLSAPHPSVGRDLLKDHEDEMVAFLKDGEFLFFPEVILCATLDHTGQTSAAVDDLFQKAISGQRFSYLKLEDFAISCSVAKLRNNEEVRSYDTVRTGTLYFNKKRKFKFSRIDGNHRLSATPKDPKFRLLRRL